MKILITSGGTEVPIDSVRHIGNMSSGTFGGNLALECIKRKILTVLVRHKNSKTPSTLPINIRKHSEEEVVKEMTFRRHLLPYLEEYTFKTYDEYLAVTCNCIEVEKPDIIIAAAAVSDYGVDSAPGKISSSAELTITMKPLRKVLPLFKQIYPQAKVVGFKLLVDSTPEQLRTAAMKTLSSGNCAMVAANDLTNIRKGRRYYTLFFPDGSGKDLQTNDIYGELLDHVLCL